MIKIFTPVLGMSPTSSLGGEIYEYQTIKGFTKRDIKVTVFLPKNRPYDKNLKNLKVIYAPMTHIVPPWIYSFICLPTLFRIFKKEKFDILRIQTPRFLGLAAAIFHLFYPKVPILCSGVTVDKTRYLYWVEKWGYQVSSAVIVQSEHMKRFIIRNYKINGDKIFVTYGGIMEGRTGSEVIPKEAALIEKKDRVLVYMSVLTKRKNAIFLLDVLKLVTSKMAHIKLIIIGDGPEKRRIKQRINDLKLSENVLLIDFAYNGEKVFWFNKMDIFLLPSLDEGFGLVATEAMTFGKTVISSNRAAFPEIIDNGVSGYTLELKRKIWADKIVMLLGSSKLREKIGQKAKIEVRKKFNWDRMYDLNRRVVEKIIS